MTEVIEKLAPALIGFMGTLVGVVVVGLGWFTSYKLTIQRELEAKRREQHLNHLAQAYRILAKVKPHDQLGTLSTQNAELQQAHADIQFLGSPEQITYRHTFAEQFRSGSYNLDPLLKSICDELRQTLGKEKTESTIWWITSAENPWVREYRWPNSITVGS